MTLLVILLILAVFAFVYLLATRKDVTDVDISIFRILKIKVGKRKGD